MAAIAPPRPDISMRPHGNKENEAVDLDRLFDEYVETDPPQHFTVDPMDPPSTDDAAILFHLPTSNGSYPIESTRLPNWNGLNEPWREAMQDPKQNRASPTMSDISFTIYPESRVKTVKSDPGLSNVDVFELREFERRLSLSNPPTPTLLNTRPTRKATPTPDQSSRRGVNKLSRKPNFQPRTMQTSHFRLGIQDMWTRRLDAPNENFNLQLPQNTLPNSPPQSVKLEQRQEGGHAFFAHDRHQPYSIAMSPLPTTSDGEFHSNYQLTPLSTPSLDTSSSRHSSAGNAFQFSNDSTLTTSYLSHNLNQQLSTSNEALPVSVSALQTPPSTSTHRLSANGADETWGSETPASLDFAFSASPDFCTPENGKSLSTWWTGQAGQPSPSPAYRERTAQSQNHSQNQNLSFSNAAVAGLGISYDTSSFSSCGADLDLGRHAQSTSFSASSVAASWFETEYPTMHHPTTTVSHRSLSIGRHCRRERTNSRSPSPACPPQPQPQMQFSRTVTHRRHNSQSQSRPHSSQRRTSPQRRKTLSNPNVSTNPQSTSPNKSHSSKPFTSASGVGAVSPSSFVNFTPLDSRKILTGVAPSGSSKTKARREKEAADKRRKLSQAAVKAVMEAGGDLGRLEREGVLFG